MQFSNHSQSSRQFSLVFVELTPRQTRRVISCVDFPYLEIFTEDFLCWISGQKLRVAIIIRRGREACYHGMCISSEQRKTATKMKDARCSFSSCSHAFSNHDKTTFIQVDEKICQAAWSSKSFSRINFVNTFWIFKVLYNKDFSKVFPKHLKIYQ